MIDIEGYKVLSQKNKIYLIPQKHLHTLIWIHGLSETPQKHLNNLSLFLNSNWGMKVIIPKAPIRYVTVEKKQTYSWFDVKFRSEKSFIVPFDQAFSSDQVNQSVQKYIKPIIEEQSKIVKNINGKLLVAGFSQGCGMSLECLSKFHEMVDSAIGVSGYLFPFSKLQGSLKKRCRVIFGLDDQIRPWKYVQDTYKDKIDAELIYLIQGMKHQFDHPKCREYLSKSITQFINQSDKNEKEN